MHPLHETPSPIPQTPDAEKGIYMANKPTTENISISVPSYILEEIDEICSRVDINRSSFFTRAAKKFIAVHHSDSRIFWECLAMKRENGNGRE